MTRTIREQLALPAAYGSPDRLLEWAEVEARLMAATVYWLATTLPDGSPHVGPVAPHPVTSGPPRAPSSISRTAAPR